MLRIKRSWELGFWAGLAGGFSPKQCDDPSRWGWIGLKPTESLKTGYLIMILKIYFLFWFEKIF
jgi:hypothetical protein